MAGPLGGIDIFVSSGARHFERLRGLLPRLRPFGSLHLVSSFLGERQLAAIEADVDRVHRPRHSEDPYRNFVLFFIRDAHALATGRYLLKIDTDVELAPDWFGYLEESLRAHPEAVLLGTHAGTNQVDYDISGPLVRERLGADVRVRGLKVNGSFCLVDLAFFRRHDETLQTLHDLIYAFRDGRRTSPSHRTDRSQDALERSIPGDLVRMRGVCAKRPGTASYDNLLSLTAHVAGAGQRLFVRDAGGRIDLPDKRVPPSLLKRLVKRIRGRAGVPWSSTGKPAVWADGSGWRLPR